MQFNQRLLQARHERGAIHNADPPFLYRDAGLSRNTCVPKARLCARATRFSECEHRGFLIAASGVLDESPLSVFSADRGLFYI